MNNNYIQHHGIKGMKWGVRRYQNADGTLTEAGKKRYDRDTADMKPSKKQNYKADPEKWVTEDVRGTKGVVDATKNLADTVNNTVRNSPKPKAERMNLDDMSDKELRDRINRELLERQYNDVFNPENQRVAEGRERTERIISGTVSGLAITSSALGIAIAIRQLLGKG